MSRRFAQTAEAIFVAAPVRWHPLPGVGSDGFGMAKTRTFFTSQEAYVRPHEGSKRHDDEVNVRAIALLETPHRFIDRQVGGANPKGVLITGNPERPDRSFIAKRPRAWLRECATEAILGTIASTLPIRIARFRLVQLPTSQGVRRSKRRQWRVATGVHFLSEVFLKPGEALVHGVEIAARFLESNPDDIREVFGLGPKKRSGRARLLHRRSHCADA